MFVRGDDQHPGYWQGVMVDITAQRAADAGIHELAESLRSIVEAAPVAITVLDPGSRVRLWNPAAERIFGWTAEETIGQLFPIVDEGNWDEHMALRVRVLAGETLSGRPLKRLRKDGTMIDVELSTAALRGPAGAIAGIVSVFEDVSERRRVADELERRAAQQAAVASLGLEAMEGESVDALLQRAVAAVAATLGVPLATVLEIDPDDDNSLLLRAGVGWSEGYVGELRSGSPGPVVRLLRAVVGGARDRRRHLSRSTFPGTGRAARARDHERKQRGDLRGPATVRRPRGAVAGAPRVLGR